MGFGGKDIIKKLKSMGFKLHRDLIDYHLMILKMIIIDLKHSMNNLKIYCSILKN